MVPLPRRLDPAAFQPSSPSRRGLRLARGRGGGGPLCLFRPLGTPAVGLLGGSCASSPSRGLGLSPRLLVFPPAGSAVTLTGSRCGPPPARPAGRPRARRPGGAWHAERPLPEEGAPDELGTPGPRDPPGSALRRDLARSTRLTGSPFPGPTSPVNKLWPPRGAERSRSRRSSPLTGEPLRSSCRGGDCRNGYSVSAGELRL